MSDQDLYGILGVSKGASDDEIKKAYRKLAMQYHPDRNQGDSAAEKKFKEINKAYEILKDPGKRQQYDNFGSTDDSAGFGGGGFGGGGFGGGDFGGMNFGDIFNDFFGDTGGRRGGGATRKAKTTGSDIRYNTEISLEEAYQGTEQEISFSINQSCSTCKGTGAKSSQKAESCSTCNGAGKVRAQQGFFIVEKTCSACQGLGEVIKDPCPDCRGDGRIESQKKLKVKIPKGVDTGTKIRIDGEGEAGFRGGPPGDLYIFVNVKPDNFFKRQDSDIFADVPIKLTTAALGGKVVIPTIPGDKVELKIPAGTQNGAKFKLKNQGMPLINSDLKGDMFVTVDIEIPVKLNSKQKELLKELDEELENNPNTSPNTDHFLKKFKNFFK